MEQVVAFGMIRITQRFTGPDLLVISINSIRFVFVGTREFLAIMVRVLFSWGWPMINYFRSKATSRSKGSRFSSDRCHKCAFTLVIQSCPNCVNSWIRHSSGQLRTLENIRPIRLTATQRVWGRSRGCHSLPRVCASLLRPYPFQGPLHKRSQKSFQGLYNAFDHYYGKPGHQSPHHTTQYFRKFLNFLSDALYPLRSPT
jgi:hypothetical protein